MPGMRTTVLRDHTLRAAHLVALLDALNGNYIIPGQEPTIIQRGAGANMSVDVGAFKYVLAGVFGEKLTTTNVAIDAADGTNPRIDLLYVTANGTLTILKGTARAAKPVGESTWQKWEEPYPADFSGTSGLILAEIEVPAGATSIINAYIRNLVVPSVARDLGRIAASDSSLIDRIRAEVLWIDETSQADVQAVLDRGGKVIFSPGSYTAYNSGNNGTYDYCLGVSDDTEIIMEPGAIITLGNAENAAIFSNKHSSATETANVSVRGGCLDGNNTQQTHATASCQGIVFNNGRSILIESVEIKNTEWVGLAFNDGSDIKIINNKIHDTASDCVFCSADDALMEGNTIYNAGDCGLVGSITDDVRAIGNLVYHCNNSAIVFAGVTHGVISGNTVKNQNAGGVNYGIAVEYGSDYITVANNNVDTATAYGIVVHRMGGGDPINGRCAIVGNTVHATTGPAISVLDCLEATISANSVYASGSYGIQSSTSGGVATIKGNSVTDTTGTGIRMDTPGTVEGNHITNAGLFGVGLYAADITCIGNFVANSVSCGIYSQGNNQTISGNVVKNSGTVDAVHSGIVMHANQYCVVMGNRCYDDRGTKYQWQGIEEENSPDYHLYLGNILYGNLNSGFSHTGTHDVHEHQMGE